jgi:DNA modification methylase
MVEVFGEVRRVLNPDGVLWLNLGDSYAATTKGGNNNGEGNSSLTSGARPHVRAAYNDGRGRTARRMDLGKLKPKDLVGIPWRVAFALQADGWYLRSDVIWAKPNPMPESVTDRPTKAHEYIFLLAKSAKYFYDAKAIREDAKPESAERYAAGYKQFGVGQFNGSPTDRRAPKEIKPEELAHLQGRNARTVWTMVNDPYAGAHFATMPTALVTRCILAGSRIGDTILDPFFGSGTVGEVAESLGRQWFGCEINPEYEKLISKRTAQIGLFGKATP